MWLGFLQRKELASCLVDDYESSCQLSYVHQVWSNSRHLAWHQIITLPFPSLLVVNKLIRERRKKNGKDKTVRKKRKSEEKNQRKNQGKIDKTLEDFLSSSISVPCCIEYQKFSSRFSVRGRIKWVLLCISCCGKLNLLASVKSWSESDIDQLSCYHGSVV